MALQNISSSDWIALSSGVIALVALVTTLWQAHLMRTHNFLSSRPVLNIDSLSRSEGGIGILIRNCGPGPAFVSAVTATFRKTQYSLTNRREFETFVSALVNSGLPCEKFTASVASNETVIAPGETFDLLLVEQKEGRDVISQNFAKLMHEVRIDVRYKSLYSHTYNATYDSPIVNCA